MDIFNTDEEARGRLSLEAQAPPRLLVRVEYVHRHLQVGQLAILGVDGDAHHLQLPL